ncbi:MAG: hypothetical protein D6736_05545 [Nitrospinota bacterium]|nr:MAG: hypothetical protein D6736_05545 [Nitrospinota bacterium]
MPWRKAIGKAGCRNGASTFQSPGDRSSFPCWKRQILERNRYREDTCSPAMARGPTSTPVSPGIANCVPGFREAIAIWRT